MTVDTTVQPKNVTHPTDAKLMLTAIRKLGEQAKAEGVPLRQSYVRVAKRAAVMAGRYAHAKQFKRMNRELKFLRTRLGRLIRDIRRKTAGDDALEAAFAGPLSKAMQIRHQRQNRRGWLFLACARDRMHRQGQGAQALRVRLQGLDRDHQQTLQGRPVRNPCPCLPRQSVRRAHARPSDRGSRSTHGARDRAGLRR